VRDINDLITLNLDIRQFAQDVIENCEGPELLRAFWHSIERITILDPTCGSGAFLFAALNVLEPLYEACLDRMELFVEDLESSCEKHRPGKFSDFRTVLDRVAAHPNRRYFVFKSIILNSLFGVDILEEAAEICKLRLFLKLAAQVEPSVSMNNLGIEPLPDIDFNIRTGNTLVGYANYDEVKKVLASKLDLDNAMEKIALRAADLQQTFDAFRQRQTEGDGSVPLEHKLQLRHRLKALEAELNSHLAGQCGVNVGDHVTYTQWIKSHQPFHWFVEFHGIVSGGGFDAIIGNPPYVEYSRSGVGYQITTTPITEKCDNLWAYVLERSINLLKATGRMSLITPLSLVSTERFSAAYGLLTSNAECATFLTLSGDAHPSVLFADVKMSYTIFTFAKKRERKTKGRLYTAKLYRWLAAERANLFSLVEYYSALKLSSIGIPFKIGSTLAANVVEKINAQSMTVARFERKNGASMLYHRIIL
jgi:hypothetical protein